MKEIKFAERFRESLKNSKYTCKELAEELGVAKSNLSNWKKGINLPSVDMLFRISILLEESTDYLLGLED
ncbi:MAG: helix-turn-helix transcriptional regulator [Clostridiales bacterium]|nr:helix-turn-helix transcriptional regulator [Clostridiales bacterium]